MEHKPFAFPQLAARGAQLMRHTLTRRYWLLPWVIMIFLVAPCGCRTRPAAKLHDPLTLVAGTVVSLKRSSNAEFRHYGEFLLQSPSRYRGKKVGLFVISHTHDLSPLVGKDITFTCGEAELTRCVEPLADPFSIGQPEPLVSLEFTDEGFTTIDYVSYEKPAAVTGVIRSVEPDEGKGALYFQFDVGYMGDMASVEIMTPAKYKGLVLHVLATDRAPTGTANKASWARVGTKVSFEISESILAWEPWGFTPADWLHIQAIGNCPE